MDFKLACSSLFVPLFFTSMQASAIDPASVSLGPVSLVPQLTVHTGHDDNIFLTAENQKSSMLTVINPSVQLIAEDGASTYKVTADISRGIFHSSTDDNYTDGQLRGDANLVFDVRNKLDLLAAYIKTHEARGTGLTQGANATINDAPVKYDDKTASAIYTYGADQAQGRIVGKLSYSVRDYKNFDAFTERWDRAILDAGVTFYYRIMPKTSLLVEVRRKDINYDLDSARASSLDSAEWKYLVGATWDATAKTTGVIKVGYANKDFSSAAREDKGSPTWETSVSWSPRTYSTFSLTGGQELGESYGNDNYIDTNKLGLRWDHEWNDRVATLASYGFESEKYDQSGRNDDTSSVKVGVSYDVRRWLTVGVDMVHAERDSNIALFDYKDNSVFLTLQGAL